jgi:hypothetical protein
MSDSHSEPIVMADAKLKSEIVQGVTRRGHFCEGYTSVGDDQVWVGYTYDAPGGLWAWDAQPNFITYGYEFVPVQAGRRAPRGKRRPRPSRWDRVPHRQRSLHRRARRPGAGRGPNGVTSGLLPRRPLRQVVASSAEELA